jgi:BlaI family transcriptional regulator, penicillinase repressor
MEVLQWVADHHPVTVRQVADHLGKDKGVVRTTVLNVMSRLVAKGYLTRKKADGVFVYQPRVPKAQFLRTLVHDFVDKALGGSVSPFMIYLAEDADLSNAELEQLKQVLRTLERPARKPSRKEQP